MSKAFTRESDDEADQPVVPRPMLVLPPGAKNYLTPDGARRLHDELNRLLQSERPPLTAAPDDDAKRQLAILDLRFRHLQESLHSAVVVPPLSPPWEQVRFGATATVRTRDGGESYRIVGVDETDIDRGWVSFLSPIARALLNARMGQKVRFKFPSGEAELEITGITYE